MGETTVNAPAAKRAWVRPLLGVLAAVVVVGFLASASIFVRWTSVIRAAPAEIEQVFAAAALEAGGGVPFVEIADSGAVTVHREQQDTGPAGFATLTVLIWVPDDDEVLRVDCPHWFVRMKTATSFNLGTMISIWRRDWGQLDLDINYDDLRRRGPGLVLDHRTKSGARIQLSTSAGDP